MLVQISTLMVPALLLTLVLVPRQFANARVASQHSMREKIFEILGRENIIHVHVATPIEVCRERDQTGGYEAADRGDIPMYPGVSAEYELPETSDISAACSVPSDTDLAVERVISEITAKFTAT